MKNRRPIFTSVAVGRLVMSSEVMPKKEQKIAPMVSLAQSEEKVIHVDTIANIDASISSGITYVIYIVMGTTARQVNVALSMNISRAFSCQSEMDHQRLFAPAESYPIFQRIKFAYIKHVVITCTQREILMSFQVCTLVKYYANICMPIMAPAD